MLKGLWGFFYSFTPLQTACKEENISFIKFQLDNKLSDVNDYSGSFFTALYTSLIFQKPSSVLVLLQYGANPNLPSLRNPMEKDTPLLFAIQCNNLSYIRLLIMHGAELPAQAQIHNLNLSSHEEENLQKFVCNIAAIKKNYDTHLNEAKNFVEKNKNTEAANEYKKTANIWLELNNNEELALYKNYYAEKALELYEQADEILKKSAPEQSSLQDAKWCEFLADLCTKAKLSNKAVAYSAHAANLLLKDQTCIETSSSTINQNLKGFSDSESSTFHLISKCEQSFFTPEVNALHQRSCGSSTKGFEDERQPLFSEGP